MVLAGILVVYRIWDAVNDPIMGTIIENTRTKWGNKPDLNSITNAIVVVLLFTVRLEGWALLLFAITYLLWDLTFTMNDIAYWSMLPALSKDENQEFN